MVAFIDDHRAEYGVEPICRVLPIALSTYHDFKRRQRDPSLLCERSKRDARLREKIRAVHEASRGVYGAPKV